LFTKWCPWDLPRQALKDILHNIENNHDWIAT